MIQDTATSAPQSTNPYRAPAYGSKQIPSWLLYGLTRTSPLLRRTGTSDEFYPVLSILDRWFDKEGEEFVLVAWGEPYTDPQENSWEPAERIKEDTTAVKYNALMKEFATNHHQLDVEAEELRHRRGYTGRRAMDHEHAHIKKARCGICPSCMHPAWKKRCFTVTMSMLEQGFVYRNREVVLE